MNFQKDIEKVLGTKHTKELVKKENAPQVGNAETAKRKEFYNKDK